MSSDRHEPGTGIPHGDGREPHSGLPVAGYRPQNQTNVDLVNANKRAEEQILRTIDKLQSDGNFDPRWLSIARTDIEKGFMALNRAIFQPERLKT